MRSREEIEAELSDYISKNRNDLEKATGHVQLKIFEVLLDIRDLLQEKGWNIPEPEVNYPQAKKSE